MIKRYAFMMNYEISSEEKDKALKLIRFLDHLLKIMKACGEHLNLIYTPFKDNQQMSPEDANAARAALRRYRDKVVDNFNIFKRQAFRAFILMQHFGSDTQMAKLIKAFTTSISDIEKQVNRFVDLFSNLDSNDFRQAVVGGIENIKKEMAEFKQIIEDRIENHIQSNILNRNWVDNISEELQEKVEKRVPLSLQLMNNDKNKQKM